MSEFIKTNQGYVRASAVMSVQQVGDMVRLDVQAPILSHYVTGRLEDVLAQLEGAVVENRPEKAPQGITGPVSGAAKERLGFGSVRDAKPDHADGS